MNTDFIKDTIGIAERKMKGDWCFYNYFVQHKNKYEVNPRNVIRISRGKMTLIAGFEEIAETELKPLGFLFWRWLLRLILFQEQYHDVFRRAEMHKEFNVANVVMIDKTITFVISEVSK